ncbi:piggyBac transposable element-derived protein 4-like [Lytechinus pictus]|uniref:piggyBac transposable element-derived protein 4-like n=1 Tax=Lytechinus pictus TaxID=7653 RepID=UPI0030B9C03B
MEDQDGENFADRLSESSSEAWDSHEDQLDDDSEVEGMEISSDEEIRIGHVYARHRQQMDGAERGKDGPPDGVNTPPRRARQPAAERRARGQARGRGRGAGRGNARRQRRPNPDFRGGWEETDNFDRNIPAFTGTQGPTEDFSQLSPLEVFFLFFTQEVWELLTNETNRYADQVMEGWDADRASAWRDHPTTVPEMKAFLGLVLLMGVVRCPRYHLHWSTMEIFYHPFFSAIMPRNRYSLLRRFLHLSDNTAPNPNNNRLHKLESFLSLLIPKFRSLYLPKKMISPDESMIKFKGRLGIVQYMPKKPIKWGIKAWALCESDSGYTWNWKVYTGREEALQAAIAGDHDGPNSHPPESSIYASGKVVLSLVEGLEGKGYWLFCDNFYTSPALFQKLNEIGFGCCGTARPLAKGLPTGANPKVHKMKKGDRPKYYKKKGQMCVVWMDKKPVTLLTTLDGPGEDVKRIRSRQGVDGHREISRPTAISTYNKHMGGVDKADQLIQYYVHQHRSLKWWKTIFSIFWRPHL